MRSLADLLEAGVPLVPALTVLAGPSSTRQLSLHVARLAELGHPISATLSGYVPPIVQSLVRAGEASGRLPDALRRAAQFLEDRSRSVQTLRREVAWPLAVVFYTFLALLLVLIFVVPRFIGLYERMRIPLPAFARTLLAIHQALQEYWTLFACLGLFLALLAYVRSGRLELVHRYHLSIFYWVLGVLLQSGVSMVEALTTAGAASGSVVIERSASLAARYVSEGGDVLATRVPDPRRQPGSGQSRDRAGLRNGTEIRPPA